jgi:hypothetical protein
MTSDLGKIEHLKGFLWLQKRGCSSASQHLILTDILERSQIIIFVPNFNFIAKFILRSRNLETGKDRHDDEPHLQKKKKKKKKKRSISALSD